MHFIVLSRAAQSSCAVTSIQSCGPVGSPTDCCSTCIVGGPNNGLALTVAPPGRPPDLSGPSDLFACLASLRVDPLTCSVLLNCFACWVPLTCSACWSNPQDNLQVIPLKCSAPYSAL